MKRCNGHYIRQGEKCDKDLTMTHPNVKTENMYPLIQNTFLTLTKKDATTCTSRDEMQQTCTSRDEDVTT